MSSEPRGNDEQLARLLAQYDEALAAETPAPSFDDSAIVDGEVLPDEWFEAKRCLELLHQIRRSTPAPVKSSLPDDTSVVASAVPRAPLPDRVGRFVIERELGRGGLGVVFLAYDPRLGRRVAIKVPRFEVFVSDDLRSRFLREAEAVARLTHPNIVTLHEVGEDGPICYLAVEYCDGPNLSEWVRNRSSFVTADQAASLVRQLADAVQHAHERGVLHRDIKPSNVLLVSAANSQVLATDQSTETLTPKLTDFGMAKLMESTHDQTRSGTVMGTLAYMAPEQAEGQVSRLDPRTDVYGLGGLLYEMLTGAPPFKGTTDADTLRQLVSSEPVAPRRIRPDLPRDLEAITQKCLNKSPADRYGTAGELCADLDRFLRRLPTRARPLRWHQNAIGWSRRRPTAAALIGVVLSAVIVLVTVIGTYTVRLQNHATELQRVLADRDEARNVAKAHTAETTQSYVADIRNACIAWKEGRLADARAVLLKHQPHEGEPDHRSFPWNYLWRLSHIEPLTVAGHGELYVCRYSRDGRSLAVAGEEGKVQLVDPNTGKLGRSWRAHQKGITSLVYSRDSRFLVTATDGDGTAVWDAMSGDLIQRFFEETIPIRAIDFSVKGTRLIAGTATGEVVYIAATDWTVRERFPLSDSAVHLLVISHDETIVATAGDGPTIHLWEYPDLLPRGTLEGHTREVRSMAYMPSDSVLASAGRDGVLNVWVPHERRLLHRCESKIGYLYDVAVYGPSSAIATGQFGAASVWKTGSGDLSHVIRTGTANMYSVAIAPDNKQVAMVGGDGLIRLWQNSAEPEFKPLTQKIHGRRIALAPDGNTIVIADPQGNLRFLNATKGEWQSTASAERFNGFSIVDSPLNEVLFSPRGDLIFTSTDDYLSQLWKYPEMTLLRSWSSPRLLTAKFSPDGKTIIGVPQDYSLRSWDVATGHERQLAGDQTTRDAALSPDGRWLAVARCDGKVSIWNASDGSLVKILPSSMNEAQCVAWSADSTRLASGSANELIYVWDTATWNQLAEINSQLRAIEALAFSPDGRTLASAGKSSFIKLWDLETFEETLLLAGHSKPVKQIMFSPGGDCLISMAPVAPCEVLVWPTR